MKKNSKPTLCFDYDFLLFQSACVTEKSQIRVINKITSEEKVFDSRTSFYGHWKNKNGGYLAEINKSRSTPYLVEDFIIEDFKETEPLDNAIYILNNSIKSICSQLDTNKYYGYTGRGDTFRHSLATLLEYKGNRKDLVKPTHLEDLKEYIEHKHNAVIVTEYEADDYCSMDAWYCFNNYNKTGNEKDKLINVAVDKDAKGVTSFLFNPNKMFEPMKIQGLGTIYREEKEVQGESRAWFYFQVCAGDTSDNYNPACLSDLKSGPITAYEALAGCSTDNQYWQAMVNHFKKLYPKEVKFTNFRGDELTVDWKYVLQEMVDLAHMKRWEEDRLIVKDILDRLEVKYDD